MSRRRVILVQDGRRVPVLREALAYLEARGLPPAEIQAVSMDALVGEPVKIHLTLVMMEDVPEPVPAADETAVIHRADDAQTVTMPRVQDRPQMPWTADVQS